MFFSIIVPIFNVSHFIQRGYKALEAQSEKDFELILVDDGSTDNSGEICEQLAGQNSEITVIHQGNVGSGAARNAGIERAKGQYIVFFDIDDILHSDALRVLRCHLEDTNPQVLIFGYNEIDEKYGIRKAYEFENALYQTNTELRDAYVEKISGLNIPNGFVWNKVYNRQFLIDNKLRFENLRIQQDEVFNLAVYAKTQNLQTIDTILYDYYIYHKGNTRSHYIPDRLNIYRRVRDAFIELQNSWNLQDQRWTAYIYCRFVDSLIYNINYNLFHPANGLNMVNRLAILGQWMSAPDIADSITKALQMKVSKGGYFKLLYIKAIQKRTPHGYNIIRCIDKLSCTVKEIIKKIIK